LADLVQSSGLSPASVFGIGEGVAMHSSQQTLGQRPSMQPWDSSFVNPTPQGLPGPESFSNPLDAVSNSSALGPAMLDQNASMYHNGPLLYPPTSDHIITLIYYNVFRGLSKNIQALQLDLKLMRTKDYQSPFITGDIDLSTLPADFQPTLIQRTIPHHPCFDIFPDAVVRDNAITNWASQLPFGHLCMNLAGRSFWQEIELSQRQGCILWGAADCADNWEVTEAFVARWPYLVKGAYRLQAATNKWRWMRGEQPLWFA